MAPGLIKAVVTLPAQSGLPADNVTNTFHFYQDGTVPVGTFGPEITTLIEQFYSSVVVGDQTTHPVGYFISGLIDRAGLVTVDQYDWTSFGPTGSPIWTETFTPPATSGASDFQPPELAVCVSFNGNATGVPEVGPSGPIPTPEAAQDMGAPATHTGRTRPASRLRNRVYVGPLIIDAFDAATGRITNGFSELCSAAAKRLCQPGTNVRLVVASARAGSYTNPVTVWCDNEPDIQRRRGRKATVRNTKTV